MNYILFDDATWDNMLPLTFTRPVAGLRVGILTLQEKWQKYLKADCSFKTRDYLQTKFPLEIGKDNIFINGSLIPTAELLSEIDNLEKGQLLKCQDIVCAFRTDEVGAAHFNPDDCVDCDSIQTISSCTKLEYPWDVFRLNGEAIEQDFKILTKGRKSQAISHSNHIIGSGDIFVEPGAKVERCTLNTTYGPIFIGKHTEIMENSAIRGPFAMCRGAVVKMGTKIYGPTTLGPQCRAGGELNNVVMQGYSNKGHDGFLGNAVLGEWCNLGADTNNSNLKNNYAEVKMWNYNKGGFLKTGMQFCGLIMGDHSKCGINTMFNTGTVVGVSANIFGSGFPRNFVPSFSWGGAQGFKDYQLKKAYETCQLVMERRGVELDEVEKNILKEVYEKTAVYRANY